MDAHGREFRYTVCEKPLGIDPTVLGRVLNVIVFTVPGVIGGQIGPHVQSRVDPDAVKVVLAALFGLVGVFMLVTLAL